MDASTIKKIRLLGTNIELLNICVDIDGRESGTYVKECYLVSNEVYIVIGNNITNKIELVHHGLDKISSTVLKEDKEVRVCYSGFNEIQCITLDFTYKRNRSQETTIISFDNGNNIQVNGYKVLDYSCYYTNKYGWIASVIYTTDDDIKKNIMITKGLELFSYSDTYYFGEKGELITFKAYEKAVHGLIFKIIPYKDESGQISIPEVIGEKLHDKL